MTTAMMSLEPITAASSRVLSIKDRRRKSRVRVPSMYTQVTVRVLTESAEPIEGYAVNVSEGGMAAELDQLIKPGVPVAVEFKVAGLGIKRGQEWPVFVAAAEVARNDDVEDFPGGPYKTALRFVKIPTIVQAQIARYIASREPMA